MKMTFKRAVRLTLRDFKNASLWKEQVVYWSLGILIITRFLSLISSLAFTAIIPLVREVLDNNNFYYLTLFSWFLLGVSSFLVPVLSRMREGK